jgi:hypothetical protein
VTIRLLTGWLGNAEWIFRTGLRFDSLRQARRGQPWRHILGLKEKVWHVRLSLLCFGQTEDQHTAVNLACAVVVDFLVHRDEDRRLQDVKLLAATGYVSIAHPILLLSLARFQIGFGRIRFSHRSAPRRQRQRPRAKQTFGQIAGRGVGATQNAARPQFFRHIGVELQQVDWLHLGKVIHSVSAA